MAFYATAAHIISAFARRGQPTGGKRQ